MSHSQLTAPLSGGEYCVQVYHHSLPSCLSDDIGRMQRRAISIICHGLPYSECLARFGLDTLKNRRSDLCMKLFDTISRPSNRLYSLLPSRTARHTTQDERAHNLPRIRLDRFKLSFIPAMCSKRNIVHSYKVKY